MVLKMSERLSKLTAAFAAMPMETQSVVLSEAGGLSGLGTRSEVVQVHEFSRPSNNKMFKNALSTLARENAELTVKLKQLKKENAALIEDSEGLKQSISAYRAQRKMKKNANMGREHSMIHLNTSKGIGTIHTSGGADSGNESVSPGGRRRRKRKMTLITAGSEQVRRGWNNLSCKRGSHLSLSIFLYKSIYLSIYFISYTHPPPPPQLYTPP